MAPPGRMASAWALAAAASALAAAEAAATVPWDARAAAV